MELLFFLGHDTPINVLSEATHQKLMPPFINVHVKAGGVDVKDLETFLLLDNDIYNDLVYLSVPVEYMEAYRASTNIKWLMWRIHNDVCHALICDNDMHDKLRHKSMMRWLHASYAAKQLLKLSSPFAKVCCDVPVDNSEYVCVLDSVSLEQTNKVYVHSKSSPMLRKSFAGCLLQGHNSAPAYLQCDFVGFMGLDDGAASTAAYTYKWPNFTLQCKRPLSSILTSLECLKKVDTRVICKDLARPKTDLVRLLEDMHVGFEMHQDSEEMYVQRSRPTLYLSEDTIVHNVSMFLSLLRKCPPFNTFSRMLLQAPKEKHTFKYNMLNDSFVFVDGDLSRCSAELRVNDDDTFVLAPLVFPASRDAGHQSVEPYLTDYYIDTLGDNDLAEQMTEYASTIKAFHIKVNLYKESWGQIKLKKYFQNIVYSEAVPSDNVFSLSYQPAKHDFIFHSSIRHEALKVISRLHARHLAVVGVHFRRERLGPSVTHPCSDAYYEAAVKAVVEVFPNACFLLSGDQVDKHSKRIFGGDAVLETNHEDEAVALCALSMCDGLILSTSSFAWWAAVLNAKGKVWCPQRWTASRLSTDLDRKLRLEDWTVVVEE